MKLMAGNERRRRGMDRDHRKSRRRKKEGEAKPQFLSTIK
jgi:hypothetical protein